MHTREKLVLIIYTLFNAIANNFIPMYSDESYYWLWSKKLALSYFDHPPMIAYIIKLTTLFSDDLFFVRLGAALLVSATAYMLYLLSKKIFNEKSAIYTFYIFLSSILVIAGSTLITPDIPLMFFASLFLYVAYVYLEENNKLYALLTGFAAGAMLLSKYPGILIIITLLVYILLYKREVFKEKYFYFALLIATVVFSPVLYWNYENDFISFTFQLHHGIAQEKIFKPSDFFNFLGAQLILFHPFYLIPLLYFIIKDKSRFDQKKVYLLLPFAFVILFFSYFAAFKHANAQWAGIAYLSASVLLGYYLYKYQAKKILIAGMILSAFVIILLKTPIGIDYVPPIQKLFSRLGKIEHFDKEIKALHINFNDYNYILIDDYHGSEIPYYLKRTNNILVLNNARMSNFNLWRHEDLNISMQSPLNSIPSLGTCLYIGRSKQHFMEIAKLFKNYHIIKHLKKKVSHKNLEYYIVEYNN
ncbi:glycosyltransferase family 39 protein [Sulfurimonas sp.]|uniref:ArnT family glycosyltransferase n=1 Tax=Sulfurimonas sp. TaxID=2022749 RepID=UPI00261E2B86|nr:glycosyltransferase family 39 protein [Sulfurimonas sp.]